MLLALVLLLAVVGSTEIRVMSISWDSAELSWTGDSNNSYSLVYSPVNSSTLTYFVVTHVQPYAEDFTIKALEPLVSYVAWLQRGITTSLEIRATGNNRTTFTTRDAPEDFKAFVAFRKIIDVLLVMCLLTAWVVALVWFYLQFSSIHLRLPSRYVNYLHIPKNIENVQVIKQANDSIIYKSYSRQMSITMEKRATQHRSDFTANAVEEKCRHHSAAVTGRHGGIAKAFQNFSRPVRKITQ